LSRPLANLAEWLGAVAVLAITHGPWVPALREVIATAREHSGAVASIAAGIGVLLFVLSCQYLYWHDIVPGLRRRARRSRD
jgi:hypothetical protein